MDRPLHPFGPAVTNHMRTDLRLLGALQVLKAATAHGQWYPADALFLRVDIPACEKAIPLAKIECLARYCCSAVCMTELINVEPMI
ncbi:hypothetical protein [Mesorhizobium sp.]|uniref:hypothetical protein n=1 Tax=Mesorhizobium sp. TaxID=1871066 RepID=UPI0025E3AB9D|nr:hypothetical protein [Mesorhizobium sp.]